MKVCAVLVAALLFLATVPASAEKVYSFEIVPGVKLGPVALEMRVAQAKAAMPDPPSRIEYSEGRNDDGTVSTWEELIWRHRVQRGDSEEIGLIIARWRDGRMYIVQGDDNRLAYRGINLYDLTLAKLIELLGPPDALEPRSGLAAWVIWNAKGVAFYLYEGERGAWKAVGVAVFWKDGWYDL